jgi:hypothetical protein
LFLILLSNSLLVGAQNISSETSNNGIIKSPVNHYNYTTNLLTLKITFPTVFSSDSKNLGSDEYYYITYSVDGEESVRIPKEYISYEISHGILIPNNLTAAVALQPLNDGYHTLTVNAREPYIVPGQSGYYYKQGIVDFTVENPTPSPSPTPITKPNSFIYSSPSPSATPTFAPIATPPLNVSLTESASALNFRSTVNFTVTTEGGKAPYAYAWYVDNQLAQTTTRPYYSTNSQSVGSHRVHVQVTDANNNTATTLTVEFNILPTSSSYPSPSPSVPEFPSAMLLSLLTVSTLIGAMLYRRKNNNRR